MNAQGIILWVILLGIVAFFVIKQIQGKRKYKDADLSVDPNWFEKSQSMYPVDDTVHQYYMHPDKNLTHQGHIVEDRNGKVVYEEKVLYATATSPFEEDFTNHIIGYSHHHQLSHASTTSAGFGGEDIVMEFNLNSAFDFDGVNIWDYIHQVGYGFRFHLHGLAYTIEVTKNGQKVGTIYTSNQGKNLYNADGPIQPKVGGVGFYILECQNKDLDALMLVALAFTKTEFNPNSVAG